MGCDVREQLGIQYLAALEKVRHAKQRVNHAVTITNLECARTEFSRVEEYRMAVLGEITAHCTAHNCATPELEVICQQPLRSGTQAA